MHGFKVLAVLTFLALSPAFAAETPAASPLNLTYQLYAGGFKVVNIGMRYELTPKTYAVHAEAATTGFWSSLVPWRNMITVRGTVDKHGVHPQNARYDDSWRERLKSTEFTFAPDGNVNTVSTPPQKKDGRTEATDAQKKGTLDPVSAVIDVLQRGGAAGCQGKIPAFDGRRVYNLVLDNKGAELLKRNDYNMYAGEAVRCEVTFEPVAGFPIKEQRAGFWNAKDNQRKNNPLIIWIAKPAPNLPELAVRVQSTGQYGTVIAHLSAIASDNQIRQPLQSVISSE